MMWLHTPNGAEVSSIYRVSFRLSLRKTQLVFFICMYLLLLLILSKPEGQKRSDPGATAIENPRGTSDLRTKTRGAPAIWISPIGEHPNQIQQALIQTLSQCLNKRRKT